MPVVLPGRLRAICTIVFAAAVIYNFAAGVALVDRLPYDFPNGGPDESMHRSLTTYLAEHLHWPAWDAPELERYVNGTSYATSSSLGYWVEGLLQRGFGKPRLAGLVLLVTYLGIAVFCFRKDTIAGLLAIAAITPQLLYVCSYVNSDAWTAVVALVLGLAVVTFRNDPTKTGNLLFLFAAAGAVMSCRYHLWPIGLVAFLYALLPQLRALVVERPKQLVAAAALGLVVASWWPLTSYFANDGDIVGLSAQSKSEQLFGDPKQPSLARPLNQIDLAEYTTLAAKSFYGLWGWANFELDAGYYICALILGGLVVAYLAWRYPKYMPLCAVLLALNFALMLVFSVQYDYQWQGRYLFPAFYLSVGMAVGLLSSNGTGDRAKKFVMPVSFALAALIACNATAEIRLARKIEAAESVDPTQRGFLMLEHGHLDAAERDFRRALQQNEKHVAALNGMGLVKLNASDSAGAEIWFQTAVDYWPESKESRLNLGRSLVRQKKFAEAIPHFVVAERISPRETYIQLRLVGVYYQVGNLEQALAHCRRAAALSPDAPELRQRCEYLERELAAQKAKSR